VGYDRVSVARWHHILEGTGQLKLYTLANTNTNPNTNPNPSLTLTLCAIVDVAPAAPNQQQHYLNYDAKV